VLIPEEKITERVNELARSISADYAGGSMLALVVLKGAFVFAADLLRRVEGVKIYCDFIKASSYGYSKESSGVVNIELVPKLSMEGERVLIVDDIVDTGYTISKIKEWVLSRGAASCRVCVLLDKPSRRRVPFQADYVGFTIPDEFVVGYGMDCAEEYRTLPYVAVVD